MELPLRAALVDWLAADPALAVRVNAVIDGVPTRATLPFVAIVASASADWSCKTTPGREVRLALELTARTDAADLAALVEARIEALPRVHPAFHVATIHFLRARVDPRGESRFTVVLEYRFRLLAV
jgi:hypothetical protein